MAKLNRTGVIRRSCGCIGTECNRKATFLASRTAIVPKKPGFILIVARKYHRYITE